MLTIDAMRILRTDLGPLEFNSNEATCFEIDFVEKAYMPRTLVKLYEWQWRIGTVVVQVGLHRKLRA